MGYVLRQGVTFCETSDRLVFLDVERDCYFCLEREAERAFRRLTRLHPLTSEDRAALADLVAAGLLAAAFDDVRPQACSPPPAPDRSLIDEDPSVDPIALAQALWHLTRCALALKVRPLRAVVAATRQRKVQLGPGSNAFASLAKIAAAFKRSALVAAPLDRCLPRSFALAHAMLDRKLRPELVFGVRLHPFEAHCWVQHREMLVNETLDQARNFTPILVV